MVGKRGKEMGGKERGGGGKGIDGHEALEKSAQLTSRENREEENGGGRVARRGERALTSKLAKGEKGIDEEEERGGKRYALTARINTLAARWSCAGTCRWW